MGDYPVPEFCPQLMLGFGIIGGQIKPDLTVHADFCIHFFDEKFCGTAFDRHVIIGSADMDANAFVEGRRDAINSVLKRLDGPEQFADTEGPVKTHPSLDVYLSPQGERGEIGLVCQH